MPVTIHVDDRHIAAREGETVLEALEREGVPVPSSCRSGACQSCLLKSLEGTVPPKAQQGLKDSLKAQGYFLSCICHPEQDITVALAGEALNHVATVLSSEDIGAAVRRVRLSIPEGFQWFAGQYVTLIREDGVARSYSVASSPSDGYLELHVRRIPGGILSNWLHDDVPKGAALTLRGASGDCFYTPGAEEAPLLLAGTGTGLAPLYGILREALRQGHRGAIRLFHGAVDPSGLYYVEELRTLAREAGIDYRRCVLKGECSGEADLEIGGLDAVVLAQEIDLAQTRAYLCGDPGLVGKMRKRLFLKGLSNRHIFADAFLPTAPPRTLPSGG